MGGMGALANNMGRGGQGGSGKPGNIKMGDPNSEKKKESGCCN